MATSPSARPASFHGVAASPNHRNAAASDTSSDRRWAMSVRTMPADFTDAASTRKPPGSTAPSSSSAGHGVSGRRSASSGGASTAAHSAVATR